MPAPDQRTIDELLADSDALARETLLDATPEIAAGWYQAGISWSRRRPTYGQRCRRRRTICRNRTRWKACGLSGRQSLAAFAPGTGPGTDRATIT